MQKIKKRNKRKNSKIQKIKRNKINQIRHDKLFYRRFYCHETIHLLKADATAQPQRGDTNLIARVWHDGVRATETETEKTKTHEKVEQNIVNKI